MEERAIAELLRLGRELDLFHESRPMGEELIVKGLHPPLPVTGQLLVWGFPILSSAQKLGLETLYCIEVGARTAGERLRLALLLEDRAGRYSWPEKENMYLYLAQEGEVSACSGLSELIEGHLDRNLAGRLEQYSNLNPLLKDLVAKKRLDLKTAGRVKGLPERAFKIMVRKGGALSFSERRLLLTHLWEISLRDKLEERQIAELARQALTSDRPLETLARLRFPRLTRQEKRLDLIRESILSDSGIRLHPPPYFEGDAYEVSFGFNSRQNLAAKIDSLALLEERSDELFSLLG